MQTWPEPSAALSRCGAPQTLAGRAQCPHLPEGFRGEAEGMKAGLLGDVEGAVPPSCWARGGPAAQPCSMGRLPFPRCQAACSEVHISTSAALQTAWFPAASRRFSLSLQQSSPGAVPKQSPGSCLPERGLLLLPCSPSAGLQVRPKGTGRTRRSPMSACPPARPHVLRQGGVFLAERQLSLFCAPSSRGVSFVCLF